MKFINFSGNTVYLDDIDREVPYLENLEPQEFDLDDAKKSAGFRQLVMHGVFRLTEVGNSLLERNLFSKQSLQPAPFNAKVEEEDKSVIEVQSTKERTGIKVRIRGHVYDAGGYAKVNRNMAIGLDRMGIDVQLDPVNARNSDLNEVEAKTIGKFHNNLGKNAILIDSMIPTFSSMGMGKYKILYTTVESETIPQQFVDAAKSYNEIWVTSDFCKRVMGKYMSNPIYVIPDTVDTKIYKEHGDVYQFNPSLKKFVFLSVFGWSYRKGYDLLLKSYLQEFDGDEDVSLLVMSRFQANAARSDVIRTTIQEYIQKYGGKNPAHLVRCGKVIPEYQMPSIYRSASSYVLFTRGEGFGLPFVEASLCGLPVISTNHSGHTMFLNHNNSTLIEIDKLITMQPGMMHIHYWDGQKFPALTDDSAIRDARDAMRWVFDNYKEAKERNKLLQKFISDNYNIDAVCAVMKDRLTSIWRNLK